MTALRRPAWWTGAAVFTAAGALGLIHGDIGWDGTWVLQVVERMHGGDVLYRDVFAGVTPMAFYVGWAATSVFGVEFAVLKLLVAVTVAVSWLASARILRRLTGSARFDWPLAAATIVCALPENASFYQPLANMFLLLAVDAASAAVVGNRGTASRRWALMMAGAACALSLLSKQNVGLYAAAAVSAIVAAGGRVASDDTRVTLRRLGVIAISFAAVVAVTLAPVVWSGGWPKFLDYAFLNKGTYLSVGGVPYVEELSAFVASLTSLGIDEAVRAAKSLALFVPILGVLAAALVIARPGPASAGPAVVLSLAAAELAGLYPRADLPHVIPVVPGLLVVVCYAWYLTGPAWPRLAGTVRSAAAIVVLAALAVRAVAAGAALTSEARVVSSVPHVRWLVMRRAQLSELDRDATRLREAGAREPVMLLVPNAGLYYLLSGLRNPTPFDYPLVTAFGRTGLADTAARIERGELPQVCMARASGLLAPEALQRVVERRLMPAADLGVCVLYRRSPNLQDR